MVLEHTSRSVDFFETCLFVDTWYPGAAAEPDVQPTAAVPTGGNTAEPPSVDNPDTFIHCDGVWDMDSIQVKNSVGRTWYWEIQNPHDILCAGFDCDHSLRFYLNAGNPISEGEAFVENTKLHVFWGDGLSATIDAPINRLGK